MRRMRFDSQCIEDQYFAALKHREALVRDLARVSAVSDIADSKSEHLIVGTVQQAKWTDAAAEYLERFKADTSELQLRDGSWMSQRTGSKRIIKTAMNAGLNQLLAVQRNWPSQHEWKQSHIIQTKDVVCVFVRV